MEAWLPGYHRAIWVQWDSATWASRIYFSATRIYFHATRIWLEFRYKEQTTITRHIDHFSGWLLFSFLLASYFHHTLTEWKIFYLEQYYTHTNKTQPITTKTAIL